MFEVASPTLYPLKTQSQGELSEHLRQFATFPPPVSDRLLTCAHSAEPGCNWTYPPTRIPAHSSSARETMTCIWVATAHPLGLLIWSISRAVLTETIYAGIQGRRPLHHHSLLPASQ